MSRSLLCVFLFLLTGFSLLLPNAGLERVSKAAPAPERPGRGTLKGKVTLIGDKPDLDKANRTLLEQIEKHKDKNHCMKGGKTELEQQQWLIDEKGGVANVIVWVQRTDDEPFKLDKIDLDPKAGGWPAEVIMDQPHCAYLPHVVVLFPQYTDPETKKLKPTGQVFKIKNSASIVHNVMWTGGPQNSSLNDNKTREPGGQLLMPTFKPDKFPITIACAIHPWMRAYARPFDHPFVAVTRKDGTYEIKNVPIDADLQVMAWHEVPGYLNGPKGETLKLKEGENEKDFTLKAK